MRTDRATHMSTERTARAPRLGYAIFAIIGGGLALWQVAALGPTASTTPDVRPPVAIGPALVGPSTPTFIADAVAIEPDAPGANPADDLDVQLESAAASAAIAAELEGDASLP